MANGKMDASTLIKGLEAVNNMSKLAANLTTKEKETPIEKRSFKEGDKTNQPHTQTVEVKVGEQGNQKPYIVHEKKETHIHKPFPDSRELSEKECEVETLRLKLDAEAKMAELDFRRWQAEEDRKERREREENAKKERDRKRAEDKKFMRRMLIGTGIAGAIGLGLVGYSMYADSRRSSSRRLAVPAPQTTLTIEAEGSVE